MQSISRGASGKDGAILIEGPLLQFFRYGCQVIVVQTIEKMQFFYELDTNRFFKHVLILLPFQIKRTIVQP